MITNLFLSFLHLSWGCKIEVRWGDIEEKIEEEEVEKEEEMKGRGKEEEEEEKDSKSVCSSRRPLEKCWERQN